MKLKSGVERRRRSVDNFEVIEMEIPISIFENGVENGTDTDIPVIQIEEELLFQIEEDSVPETIANGQVLDDSDGMIFI